MTAPERQRLQVKISAENHERLNTIIARHGGNRGAIVDEALSLLFLPPDRRPGAELSGPLSRIETALDRLDAAVSFQTDLMIEFILDWFAQSERCAPDDPEAFARDRLETLIRRVVDQVSLRHSD